MDMNSNVDVLTLMFDTLLNSDHLKNLKLKFTLMIENIYKDQIM